MQCTIKELRSLKKYKLVPPADIACMIVAARSDARSHEIVELQSDWLLQK